MGTADVDLFVAMIPYDETRTYVARVMSNHARYRYLVSGEQRLTELALELPRPNTEGAELY